MSEIVKKVHHNFMGFTSLQISRFKKKKSYLKQDNRLFHTILKVDFYSTRFATCSGRFTLTFIMKLSRMNDSHCLIPAVCSSSAAAECAAALCSWWKHSAHSADSRTCRGRTQSPAGLPSPAADWNAPAAGHCPSADANIKDRNGGHMKSAVFKLLFRQPLLNAPLLTKATRLLNISTAIKHLCILWSNPHRCPFRYVLITSSPRKCLHTELHTESLWLYIAATVMQLLHKLGDLILAGCFFVFLLVTLGYSHPDPISVVSHIAYHIGFLWWCNCRVKQDALGGSWTGFRVIST